ncbi:MAG TPA: 3-hydroxyacyl-CoA dehydrogenase NAD-binding domain-containing protein, partial [Vicinamibacterales bacterium]|nr:3-hydroxyacyl-CoA dehydrogenase NAD-binding domain-containing protein [Vicinamibacterales bacterium]
DLAEDEDIVEQHVADVLDIVRPTTRLEAATGARVVFEAAPEDLDLKLRLLRRAAGEGSAQPWVFTNTSSIPIEEIDAKAALGGRTMGFHFYNPPAVQKLVELIRARTTAPGVPAFAETLARNLGKTVVWSRDHAGFIGNGHFMRDLLHAIGEVERLGAEMPFAEAVYSINRVSQDFLVRPMGIFQLADYVGLDVCQGILRVMDERLPERLHSRLVDRMIAAGVRGGQNHDGSQKDGLLRYERGRPAGVYDPAGGGYLPFSGLQAACDARLGPLPDPAVAWKTVVRDPAKDTLLAGFFRAMGRMKTPGAGLARRYGLRSREIGLQLVADGVAERPEDVNQVLLTGFFHAYGPINDYFPETGRA